MTSRMEFRNYRSSAQLVHCNIHQKRYSDVPALAAATQPHHLLTYIPYQRASCCGHTSSHTVIPNIALHSHSHTTINMADNLNLPRPDLTMAEELMFRLYAGINHILNEVEYF